MSITLEKINKKNGQVFNQDDIAKIDSNSTITENELNNLNTNKADIIYENPIEPTLINSWVNYGTPYSTVGYWKDSLGMVHLKGTIKNGVSNSTAFQLPNGYRPNTTVNFASSGSSITPEGNTIYICVVTISPVGNIIPSFGVETTDEVMTMVSLENISFRAGV